MINAAEWRHMTSQNMVGNGSLQSQTITSTDIE